MYLKNLSDEELLNKMDRLDREEKEKLAEILHHLREIDSRRLFSSLGYKSLYEFTIQRFGYSEDQAYRRIAAARLLKDLPEIEHKINEGALSLSNLGKAHALFQKEKKRGAQFTSTEKLQVLENLENKTAREAEKIILSRLTVPETLIVEKIRPITPELSEMKFPVNEALLKKIEKLKGLLAHSNPQISMSELLDKLCDLGIDKWDKATAAKRPATSQKHCVKSRTANLSSRTPSTNKEFVINQQASKSKPTAMAFTTNSSNRNQRKPIPKSVQRLIWQKAKSECEICSSKYALEIDHILPIALSGTNALENMRLLCRACNQRQAIRKIGADKMQKYWRS